MQAGKTKENLAMLFGSSFYGAIALIKPSGRTTDKELNII